MAVSSGSIHVTDNSVTAINEAIRQLMDFIDELKGNHNTVDINIGPHSHSTSSTGSALSHDDLSGVSIDDHHARDHTTRHQNGGADPIKLDDLATPDDNTDLNASISAHGLLPKLSNSATQFLDGTGSFSTPVVSGTEATDVANIDGDATSPVWEQLQVGRGIAVETLANGSAMRIDHGWTLIDSWTYASDVAQVDFINLHGYHDILILCNEVTLSIAGLRQVTVSIDNGATFLTTSGDYTFTNESGTTASTTSVAFHTTTTTAARSGQIIIMGWNLTTPKLCGALNRSSVSSAMGGRIPTANELTAIRVNGSGGGNLTGGSIQIYGR